MSRASNRKNITLLALAVVMLGFGVVIPVFPFYIQSMGASGDELGLLIAILPFMQLICAPIWGSISDRVGRKPVLMAGILGYGLSIRSASCSSLPRWRASAWRTFKRSSGCTGCSDSASTPRRWAGL